MVLVGQATSGQAERAPRKPYVTSNSRREAWIGKIHERYNRTPTAHELLALDNLPCAPPSQLFDRSGPGVRAYQRLRYAEATGDASVLEEAGRILRQQMADPWTPVDSDATSDATSTNVPAAWTPATAVNAGPGRQPGTLPARRSSPQPHGPERLLAPQAARPPPHGPKAMPTRSCPAASTSASPTATEPPPTDTTQAPAAAAAAPPPPPCIIHGDVYYMPTTIHLDGAVFHASSLAIASPGRPTATYPEPLTADRRRRGA